MSSGYVNEGGELRSNGRTPTKYQINTTTRGDLVISRCLAAILALMVVLLLTIAVLATYFLVPQCSGDDIMPMDAPVMVMEKNIKAQGGRLPDHFLPNNYKMTLRPDIVKGFTDGEIWIDATCVHPDAEVVLDIGDMDIDLPAVKVQEISSDPPKIVDTKASYGPDDTDKTLLVIKLSEAVNGTRYQIHVKFRGQLNDQLQGFYKASYIDIQTNERRWLASTQFSPTDARRAFPCFDRPGLKATFDITIIRPRHLTAISNMPIVKSEPLAESPELVQDQFDRTPRMSTYLVAFIVSDLVQGQIRRDPQANNTSPNYDLFVWSRRDVQDQTQFAHELALTLLQHMERYFEIPFPLPKIDMVAVPEFGFSAMENWGLITFRESVMLIWPRYTSEVSKQRSATTMSHELAHQWFGNLVTPHWWNDLWLKEGFATYIGYLGVENAMPSWRMNEEIVIDVVQDALVMDSGKLSHPISVAVDTPSEIRTIFDPISYNKGASIIRMMQAFLGEKTFKAGVVSWLRAHAYGNADQDDLWAALTAQAHEDGVLAADVTVKDIMDTWTLQAGYPVLHVSRSRGKIDFKQERFVLPAPNSSEVSRWWIPVSLTSGNSPDFETTTPLLWLSPEEPSKNQTFSIRNDTWVLANVKETGFYRVNYDRANWMQLDASFTSFPELTRAQLLDDVLNLARGHQVDYDIALALLSRLSRDVTPLPWAAVVRPLSYIHRMLAREPAFGHYIKFMRVVVERAYASVQFEEHETDDHIRKIHRANIIDAACSHGNMECMNTAQRLYRHWMGDKENNTIPTNLKRAVYCTAIREGGVEDWDFAYKMYKATILPSEKEVLLDAMGCSSEPWVLSRYLQYTLEPNFEISKQDGARVFQAIAYNKVGHEIAVNHLIANFQQIYDHYGEAFSTVKKMIEASAAYMNKDSDKIRLEKFAEKLSELGITSAMKTVEVTIETVENNIYWRSVLYPEVEKWLIEHNTKFRL